MHSRYVGENQVEKSSYLSKIVTPSCRGGSSMSALDCTKHSSTCEGRGFCPGGTFPARGESWRCKGFRAIFQVFKLQEIAYLEQFMKNLQCYLWVQKFYSKKCFLLIVLSVQEVKKSSVILSNSKGCSHGLRGKYLRYASVQSRVKFDMRSFKRYDHQDYTEETVHCIRTEMGSK